jgi:aminopeptidase N
MSKFSRPWLLELRGNARARVGPIGHGIRASTAEMPSGYEVQTYVKGPLVVNMLREILRARSHNDDAFLKILREYVRQYDGKEASTADFQKVVESTVGSDWNWFFNDWIYSAEIPTVRWSYKVQQDVNGAKLSLTVKRSDVPPDFIFLVPVRVEFEGGKSGYLFVNVKDNEQTITKDLPMVPRNVVFAPDFSLLANIKKE